MNDHIACITTPLGNVAAAATREGLTYLSFMDNEDATQATLLHYIKHSKRCLIDSEQAIFSLLREELNLYFKGKLQKFTLPIDLGGTDFQQSAWHILTQIPYGQTLSYSQQAVAIGNPGAVRAVAMANHYNPVSIIIPCHRVIGKNGRLVGYGSGLWRKAALLKLEEKHFADIYF